ncbi:hypothetical protein OCU04_009105 [Sclerotinia nivalis]|uniref:Uncharacterized protein n=1 Tax=Sclerotinia nivalis TaxID=352851 RepID=A0A9X0DGE7_9HELO|nr:hypothetical protein OCU04_009105 [Sclerotinia nivalis]
MAARFSRLFDNWDQDYRDLSMLELGSNVDDSPLKYHSPQVTTEHISSAADLSERRESILERSEATTDFTPFDNRISPRHLLDGGDSYVSNFSPSVSFAHDYQALRNVGRDSLTENSPSEPRLRNGFGVTSNMKIIWKGSTAFTKPRPSSTFCTGRRRVVPPHNSKD